MYTRIAALLFLFLFKLSLAADIAAHNLVQTYSHNDRVCKEAAALLTNDKACRPFDAVCSDEESYSLLGVKVFEEAATGTYGYESVFRSSALSEAKFAIVYIEKFQGDRHPRLVETWKVDSSVLDAVLSAPDAVEFEKMLSRGEKIADEWSPVINIYGEPYAIERECSGRWGFGAYYGCNKVIKLTLKKLAEDKTTIPSCQFSKPRNRKK